MFGRRQGVVGIFKRNPELGSFMTAGIVVVGLAAGLGYDSVATTERRATFPDSATNVDTLGHGAIVASGIVPSEDEEAVDCGGTESGLGINNVDYEEIASNLSAYLVKVVCKDLSAE